MIRRESHDLVILGGGAAFAAVNDARRIETEPARNSVGPFENQQLEIDVAIDEAETGVAN